MLTPKDLVTLSPNLIEGNIETKRTEIKHYFNQTYDTYEALFLTLKSDSAFYERPCSLRHPLIFYFGHTATFFTNKLVLAKLLPKRINPHIESMCAIGVDEMSWDDLDESHYDWPSAQDIRQYRQQVRQAVNNLIDHLEFTLPIDWQSPMWPIMMGIEHERIHLETSSVLIRQLPIQSVQSTSLFPICPLHDRAPNNTLINIPAGNVTINHQDPSKTYGWDNEYGHHQADINAFKAACFLTSNQEYLEFIEAGGYDKAEFWNEEGNQWRTYTASQQPTFWVNKGSEKEPLWYLRCMTEEIPMPWNWPVEVNQLEAHAFCQWKSQKDGVSIRLPSEDEYLRLRDHSQALSYQEQANFNLQQYASSTPITHNKTGDFYDVLGNVWQWTQTPIYPYAGFKVHPLYDDFTLPTFDNQHNIVTGGSWISTGNEINGHSRYAFRRHFFQHAGFRYIESDSTVQPPSSTYETDSSISQYCEFHYGDEYFGVENFAKAYANIAIGAIKDDIDFSDRNDLSVLEIGCSVGRACFELARHFHQITGLDFSARFIQVANQLQNSGSIRYAITQEGDLMDFKSKSLADLNLAHNAQSCQFRQQDAVNLKPQYRDYDMIVAVNLIDRLYDPAKFLSTIHQRMNSKGLLLIGSPYTWLETFTDKTHWIGGYKDPLTGENVTTLEGLHCILDTEFELVQTPFDVPFVIRETQRKFQHSLSEFSLWKKRH